MFSTLMGNDARADGRPLAECQPHDSLTAAIADRAATYRTATRPAARIQPPACYLAGVLKLLLISVLLATFVLPALTASGRRPLSALRAMLTVILLAELAYAFFLRFIYDRLV